MRLIRFLLQVFRNVALMPGRVANLQDKVDSLMYMQILSATYPEAAAHLLADRRSFLPGKALEELGQWDGKKGAINIYRNTQALIAVDLASRMVAVCSKEEVSALFQEALAMAGDDKTAIVQRYVEFLNKNALDTPHLLEVMEQFERMRNIWEPRFARIWAIYIAALVRAGDLDKASTVLKRYAAIYKNLRCLAEIVPAARFAHANGFSSKLVAMAALVAEETEKNAKMLESMLRAKSVAVVGNGPFELGRGRGREIDAHDVVIRFNLTLPDSRTAADYGRRTDIMALNGCLHHDKRRIPRGTIILLSDGLERFPVRRSLLVLLASLVKHGTAALTAIPMETHLEIARLGCLDPSSGLAVIALVKSFNPEISQKDLYGFAHTRPEETEFFSARGQYHYDVQNHELPTGGIGQSHSLGRERECFGRLFAA